MKTESSGQRLCDLHDDLVRTIIETPGVSRLVPSYREILTRSAKALFGSADREASGVDIVTRASGTRIYVDFYVAQGHATGMVVDDVHDAAQLAVNARRSQEPLGEAPAELDNVDFTVRVLGIE